MVTRAALRHNVFSGDPSGREGLPTMPLISRRSLSLTLAFSLLGAGWAAASSSQAEPKARHGTITRIAAIQSRDGNNRSVRVHNQTGLTIVALQASSGSGWTSDLLRSSGLAAGRSVVVAIDDGTGACRYALRARFDTGETLERGGINSCQIADYYFTR
ncbi:hypothetical protein [Brevundimonas bacteroides]|uniref:hypothetical protein n=1 Tax=Brevundimonas bacteroides TaxID=74311 RepID=UPI00068F2EE1|nr:hypothetical protein [Brevundimonas bacteroides]